MGHIAATLAALDEEAGYLPKGFPEKAAREAERAIMLKARAVPRNLRSLTALSQCSVAIIALPPEAVLGASNVADTVHALASIVTSGYAIYLSAAASAATSHSDFAATIAKQVGSQTLLFIAGACIHDVCVVCARFVVTGGHRGWCGYSSEGAAKWGHSHTTTPPKCFLASVPCQRNGRAATDAADASLAARLWWR